MATMLKAGFGEADLRAPLGGSIPGYFADRKAEGVLDPLMAKAIVLQQDNNLLALVALDLIGVPAPTVAACRKAIAATTGIPASKVLIHASHTHTGAALPRSTMLKGKEDDSTKIVYPGEPDPDWVVTLHDRVAQSVRLAVAALKPSPMHLGSSMAPDLAFIRRFRMKDGSILTNPGYANPNIAEPLGESDPTVTVLGFPASKAAVVIFGVHPDVVGGTKYSADWSYHASNAFRREVGRDWNIVLLNAACGNINHIDVRNPKQGRGYEESTRIGTEVGLAAARAWKTSEAVEVSRLGIASTIVESKIRVVPEADLVEARRILKDDPTKAQPFNGLHANSAITLATSLERSQPAEIMAARIGPVGLVGMPGEIFVELARMVQHDAPLEPTRTIGLCNGSLGYIPHAQAYEQGGYEAGYRSARFAAGTGERWAEAAVKLLKGLA